MLRPRVTSLHRVTSEGCQEHALPVVQELHPRERGKQWLFLKIHTKNCTGWDFVDYINYNTVVNTNFMSRGCAQKKDNWSLEWAWRKRIWLRGAEDWGFDFISTCTNSSESSIYFTLFFLQRYCKKVEPPLRMNTLTTKVLPGLQQGWWFLYLLRSEIKLRFWFLKRLRSYG